MVDGDIGGSAIIVEEKTDRAGELIRELNGIEGSKEKIKESQINNNNINVSNSNSSKITKDIIKSKVSVKPYIVAIKNLRKVREYESPIDKMRCITQTSKFIV